MTHCDYCPYAKDCELAHEINFCEDCKDYDTCTILSSCDGGHYVECNNGFEPKDEIERELMDEFEIFSCNDIEYDEEVEE